MGSRLKEIGNFVVFDPRYLFFALIRTLAYFPVLFLGAYFPFFARLFGIFCHFPMLNILKNART